MQFGTFQTLNGNNSHARYKVVAYASDAIMQDKLIKKHAPAALIISATLFAAGAMVGVFDGTGMLEAMASAIMAIIPAALGKYIHIIFGILALPLGLCVGTDAYFYGIMPLVMQVGETYGVASLNTALTMLIGKNLALMVSPLVPATYLAIGLTGTELKDHMKFSIPPYYLVSLLMLAFGVILGIVTVKIAEGNFHGPITLTILL